MRNRYKLFFIFFFIFLNSQINSLRFSIASQNGGYNRGSQYTMNTKMHSQNCHLGGRGSIDRSSYQEKINAKNLQSIEGDDMIIEMRKKPSLTYTPTYQKYDQISQPSRTRRYQNQTYLNENNSNYDPYW